MPEEKGAKVHYGAIDGLRAFAAIGIVFMHVLANGNYKLEGFVFESLIPSFTHFVFLFMIISGFATCCGYYDRISKNQISIETFYKRRFEKVWPFFALLCMADLIVAPSINSLYEVFANLTLCFGLLPNANISVIGVGWFLGVVFVFYFMFPFFCYLISDKRRAWFAFLVSLLFNILCSEYFGIGRTSFAYCLSFFLAGGLVFLYKDILKEFAQKYKAIIFAACVLTTILYYWLGPLVGLMIVLFVLYLIYAIGVSKTGVLSNRIVRFLSGISLEIYLSHMFVYRILEKLRLVHVFDNSLASYTVTSLITVCGTIAFAVTARWGLNKIKEILRRRENG